MMRAKLFFLFLVLGVLNLKGQNSSAAWVDRLAKFVEKRAYPGAMISIVRSDSILFVGGVGYANPKTEERVNEQHLFRQGSISKSFTALALIQVLKEKGLDLNTPIREIDANLPFVNKWAESDPITVASVLENSAGFDDFHAHAIYSLSKEGKVPTAEMVAAHQNSLYTRWRPNTRHAYSNSGYILAGHLIEVLSEQPYADYIKERILEPLGMEHSGFYFKKPELPFAQGHKNRIEPIAFAPLNAGPAGDFCSNANEMALFLQFMLNRNGALIDATTFTDSTFDRIENAQTTLAARNGLPGGYSLGNFSVWQKGYPFHGHNGAIDGFSSRYIYSREADLGIAVAGNRLLDVTPIVEWILEEFLSEHEKTSTTERSVAPLSEALKTAYSGFYVFRNPRQELKAFINDFANNFILEFKGEKGYLKDLFGNVRDSLTYAGNHLFYRNIESVPSFVLMESENGVKAVGMKRNYAEKESLIWRMFVNFLVLLSMFLLGAYLAYFGIWTIIQLVKKRTKGFASRLPLFIACLSFPILFYSFIAAVSVRETAGQLTFWSGTCYASSYCLLIFTFIAGTQIFRIKESRAFRNYHLITLVALVIVSIFLKDSSFLFLRLWAY